MAKKKTPARVPLTGADHLCALILKALDGESSSRGWWAMRADLAAALTRDDRRTLRRLLVDALATCLTDYTPRDQALVIDFIDSLAAVPPAHADQKTTPRTRKGGAR